MAAQNEKTTEYYAEERKALLMAVIAHRRQEPAYFRTVAGVLAAIQRFFKPKAVTPPPFETHELLEKINKAYDRMERLRTELDQYCYYIPENLQ